MFIFEEAIVIILYVASSCSFIRLSYLVLGAILLSIEYLI